MLRGARSGSSRPVARERKRARRLCRVALVAVAVVSSIGAAQAVAGEIGIPCTPGAHSPNGFEPCSLCPSGTYNRFEGAIQCQPCREGTYAVGPGATTYEFCECRDEALCTIDRCDATTGACTAHDPAPSCQPYAVHVEGVVTEISGLAAVFTLGQPITGSWIIDPSELERSGSPMSGTYPNGAVDLRMRVGTGPSAIEGVGTNGSLYVESTPPRDSDYLDLVGGLATPGYTFSGLTFTLDDGDDPAIVSNAIPATFPAPASFASRYFGFTVYDGENSSSAGATQFSVSVPEPQAGAAGLVGVAALLAIRRRRGAFRLV